MEHSRLLGASEGAGDSIGAVEGSGVGWWAAGISTVS